MYRRKCCLKSSFSLGVLSALQNLLSPSVASSFSSATSMSGLTIRCVCMILVMSCSLMPRDAWYDGRFFGMVVQ